MSTFFPSTFKFGGQKTSSGSPLKDLGKPVVAQATTPQRSGSGSKPALKLVQKCRTCGH